MSDIELRFIILRLLLAFCFLCSGYFLTRAQDKGRYWLVALFPIISFAIVSGLRFGRDIDYNAYYFFFVNKNEYESMEPLFSWIVQWFHMFDLPYYVFVLFCSTALITSFLYFLYPFRKTAFFLLPLFLGFMGIENLIRWYLAFSFVLIGTPYLVRKNYITSFLLFLASYFIHSGMIIVTISIAGFYFFANKHKFNSKAALLLFILTLFLGSTSTLITLSSYLNYLPFLTSEKELHYLERAQDIASGGMGTGIYERSVSNNVRLLICFGVPLLFSPTFFRYKKFVWLFNLAVFSIVLMPLFSLVEIFNRVSDSLMFFSYLFVSIVIYKSTSVERKNTKVILLFLVWIVALYPIFTRNFNDSKDSQKLFLWDSKNMNYLNNY